jgi:hypothetical protein
MSETSSPIHLPRNVGIYIDRLTSRFPEIESVWLIGSRANPPTHPDSDWDFIVFATPHVLASLRADQSFHVDSYHLLVVYDGDHFDCPWSQNDERTSESRHLKIHYPEGWCIDPGWQWNQISDRESKYVASRSMCEDIELYAYRIYPK